MGAIAIDEMYLQHSRRDTEMEGLRRDGRMYDAVIEELQGRRIRIGSEWLVDWASCNYLGFDLEPEIQASIAEQIARWGTHPSWSRLLGNPRLYVEIEERLTELLGAPDTLVLATITHIHMSVIPALAGRDFVFYDARAHKTIHDGCMVARGMGATVQRFRPNDYEHLDELLRDAPRGRRLVVCMDGVNSMTGNIPDVSAFARVCREHNALLYLDDAHGFGVIGQRPSAVSPYGTRGNSIVRYFGETYENIILVGGFSKAYSSLLAFIALPTDLKNHLKVAAPPYLYSGPSPTASLASVLAGFDVNERRGDSIRADLRRKSGRVLEHLHRLGVRTLNTDAAQTPIIEVPIARPGEIGLVNRLLRQQGAYVTVAAYPLVPQDEVGFRIQVTAANTDAEIDELLSALTQLAERRQLQAA